MTPLATTVIRLSSNEANDVSDFLASPKCKAALNAGGRYALVFGPSNGIGMPVEVTVQHPNGTIYRKDVTDVGSW